MEKEIKNIILWVVGALVVTALGLYGLSFLNAPASNGNRMTGTLSLAQIAEKSTCQLPESGASLADFATCLKDKGVIFYGAHWCPHCQDQKAMFGDSMQYVPYVECATPESTASNSVQLPVCNDAGIQSYPTWDFSNVTK